MFQKIIDFIGKTLDQANKISKMAYRGIIAFIILQILIYALIITALTKYIIL